MVMSKKEGGVMEVNEIIHADVFEGLKQIPDNFVDCIITSPPYYGLRDYSEKTIKVWDDNPDCEHEWKDNSYVRNNDQTAGEKQKTNKGSVGRDKPVENYFCVKCGAWSGQLGLEPTLNLYLKHLLQVTAELKRVLKPTGVLFWVHGDSFGGSWQNYGNRPEETGISHGQREKNTDYFKRGGSVKDQYPPTAKMPAKCMLMQPERLAMRMVDEQGWILRNKIVWHKPNHMPESVQDRFTSAYEYVFMFTKNKKYWFDLDAVREPHRTPISDLNRRIKQDRDRGGALKYGVKGSGRANFVDSVEERETNLKGKNPSDVWQINTEPYPDAHFAIFPESLVERCLKVACPEQVCKKCGKARVRITETESYITRPTTGRDTQKQKQKPEFSAGLARTGGHVAAKHYTTGWTDCGCNAGWDKGIVLDPFMGSGTTALVALKLNRNFIGIEINKDYVDMAYRRVKPYLEQERLEKWLCPKKKVV